MIKQNSPAVALLLALLLACKQPPQNNETARPPQSFDPSRSDPKALDLVEALMDSVGADRFGRASLLSFDFFLKQNDSVITARSHQWKIQDGEYTLSWQEPGELQFTVVILLQSSKGRAYRNGEPIQHPGQNEALVRKAYASFLHDTYWLLLPFKLKDPGVILSYIGKDTLSGSPVEVVQLSFDRVGLTPENSFKLYIDPQTTLIKKWEFFKAPGDSGRPALWDNWIDIEGMKFATHRWLASGPYHIEFRNIRVEMKPEPPSVSRKEKQEQPGVGGILRPY